MFTDHLLLSQLTSSQNKTCECESLRECSSMSNSQALYSTLPTLAEQQAICRK